MHLGANYTETLMKRENVGIVTDVAEYIELHDQGADSSSMEMGGRTTHKRGVLLIAINTPKDDGTARSRAIADILAGLIEKKGINSITFEESELHTVGDIKDSPYFQQVLQTPYQYFYGQDEAQC